MKKRITALLLCLVMVFSLIPTTVWAASNSTVVLHPSVGSTVTGVKVKVGDQIDGHAITSISGYDITVDLGKYNVNNDNFRLPYAKDIWEGVDNNKVDYISWAGSGSNKRSEGGSALLANGKNTAYYYFKGAPVLLTFTLNYDANGGTGAPASQTYKATSEYEKSHTFTISSQQPTRDGYTFLGWNTNKNATSASYQPGGSITVTATYTTLYAIWEKQHEHNDGDGDGFCDDDNTCMHPKDDKGNCTVPGCTHPDSCCPKPEAPKPTEPTGTPTFTDVNGQIRVQCTAYPSHHEPHAYMYGITSEEDYTDLGQAQEGDTFTYSIELNRASFIDKFDAETNREHEDEEPNEKAIVTWRWDGDKWNLISGPDGITADIKCICNEEIDPSIPQGKPNWEEQLVRVNCETEKDNADYNIPTVPGTKKWFEESFSDDGYTYTMTINKQAFIDNKFSSTTVDGKRVRPDHVEVGSAANTIVWTWDKENGAWVCQTPDVEGTAKNVKVCINVKCTAPATLPSTVMVMVECVADKHPDNFFGIAAGSYTTNGVEKNKNGEYVFSVTLKDPDSFLDGYNNVAENGKYRKHIRVGDPNMTITWKWIDGAWVCQNEVFAKGGVGAPADAVLKVQVKCVYNVNFDADGGTPVPDAQEVEWNEKATEPTTEPTKKGYVFKGWYKDGQKFDFNTPITGDVTLKAEWEKLQTVQVVIYRNGNISQPVKTVTLDPQLKGTVIDLTKLNIETYYGKGSYDFYGWYNDGTWNAYKADPTNPPAGLESITVNGWTNIICMVYTHEQVVYFQSAQALKDYQNDHSKTEGLLFSTSARFGTALPTADAPTATREGYSFKFWSREGQSTDVTGQTVSGWTNLYANWEANEYTVTFDANGGEKADPAKKTVTYDAMYGDLATTSRDGYTFLGWFTEQDGGEEVTNETIVKTAGNHTLYAHWAVTPHNVYAFARVNSTFAPLTSVEFGDYVTLNDATLSRLGLGSYNANGYISIGVLKNFDEMALAADMYFGNDAELAAVVNALADNIVLEQGVDKKTAKKIAWTYLFQVDNSDYMTEAGYPTKDDNGYQLSGNLNLATVMFNAGANDVENMPVANYTYDDVIDIYDFYFDGDTFTLPTTEPTRKGYTFKGWSAEVLVSDVDVYDADTDADADLYKAGDEYTIKEGGVKFTAQWEIKTYIIASDLRLNGNETVKETGKTYSWTHRYGGNYGEIIDYTEMFDELTKKAMEVDAANEPFSVEIKLCVPKSDELFNEKILTYGQDGAGWNPGVKNTAYIWGYATTSYQVIFDAKGGSAVDTQIVNYGEKATAPTTELKGYDFLGWYDAEGNLFDFDTEITHKTTLTAKWEKKTYTIAATLYLNGADKDHPVMVDDGRYPWSHRYSGKFEETISYDEMFKVLKDRAMEVDAANDPIDSVVTLCFPGDYPATAEKLFNETILTYGQDGGGWNPGNKNTAPIWGFAVNVYGVTFDYMIEGNTDANTTLRVNYNEQVAEPESLTRTGYTFIGWYTDADCTEGNEFDFTTPITKSMTLYAKWQVNQYKVTYDANGGVEADPSEAMVDFGAKVPNSTTTREGYTFLGWFVGDTDAKWDFENGTMGAEDMTLTAHWQANEYKVTFDANGGVDADPESKTVTYDAEYGDLAETSREGYTFLGWYTEEDGDDKVEETTIVKTAEDHTLYAHWQINVYTVKFVSFDEVVATQEVEHGKTATRIKTPETNDYVFKGWYLNGQLYDFNTPVTSDITLVAQWVTKTPSSNPSTPTKTETKDNGKVVQSGKTFDGGIALYVGLSVLSVTGSAWVITKKKRG